MGEELSSFSLRSSEFRRSKFVEPRVKVHLLDEGYVWVPKRRGFIKDPKEEFSGNQRFRAREASHPCYHALRGRDSLYLCLFFIFWAKKMRVSSSSSISSPRRMELRLGEDVYLLQKDCLFA